MIRRIKYGMFIPMIFLVGCYGGSWCGNHGAYPIGTYPWPNYQGGGYPPAGYPPAGLPAGTYAPGGTVPAGVSSTLGTPPLANSSTVAPTLPYNPGVGPNYSTPLPNGVPQNTPFPYGSYPGGYYGQPQGVPMNNFSTPQPFFGR